MDREGFRNRLKQYKKAREENPGLKYWEWKAIPKYEEGVGGVTVPKYRVRGRNLDLTDAAQEAIDWTTSWHAARKATGKYDDQYASMDEYAQRSVLIAPKQSVDSTGSFYGTPQLATIRINPDLKPKWGNTTKSAIVHELAHEMSLQNAGERMPINLVKGSSAVDKVAEITGVPLYNTNETDSSYEENAAEYYARLSQMREAMKADPNKTYELPELKPWLKLFDLPEDERGVRLMNDVASVNHYNDDGVFMAAEGGIVPKYDEGGKIMPTQEEYIAEQIAARKAAALEKSLSRTMPRVPQGIKTGERWNPVTKKVEDIHECGPSCAYTFSDNYGLNWMGSEDFKQNHANYGWKQVPWEQRQPGNAVLIVDDSGTAKHTMMYDSDNAQGQPLFNHSNGGHNESAIRKKAKYPHHNPYLTYEFVGTPADSTQWINDYKKIYGFAEGTYGVTGPPTYEQWDADMNKYNPTILDDASMYWSIEAAKKALHNEAMKLPGYAERWTEYYRSLPKNDPDINEFVDELWANENPNNVGYKNGKYYPHKSPEGGKPTIGPGFKIGSGSHRITKKQAERGMTKARLNQEARYIGKQHLNAVDQFINYGQTTNPADTVSPQIKMGLMDLRHQVGPLNEWGNLREAVLNGDLEGIRKESTVTWKDNGKTKVDKRRKKIRDEKYFYYE